MANTLTLKRSSVASKIPLTTDLQLGELAINTYDGRVFLKRDNGTASIVELLTSLSTIPVSSGGTGATTLTGLIKGNGTSAFTAAVAGTDYVVPSALSSYLPLAGGTLSGSLTISAAAPRITQTATTGTNSSLVQLGNTGGTAYLGLDNSGGGLGGAYSLNIWHTGNYPVIFGMNNAEKMRLDSTGLGIGRAAAYPFDLALGSNQFARIATNSGTAANDAGILFLTAASATAASRRSLIILDPNGANGTGADYFMIDAYGNGGVGILTANAGTMSFGTNNSTRFTLDGTTGVGNFVSGLTVGGTSVVVYSGALGTPTSGVLSNCTTATAAKSSASTTLASTEFVKSVFVSPTTAGTLDWNDASNLTPGVSDTLLLGNATNGPGPNNYYHPLNIAYASYTSSGSVTQLAIAYGSPGNDIWMRGRYSGAWSSWTQLLNSGNYGSYALPLTGGTVSGTTTFSGNTYVTGALYAWFAATPLTGAIYLNNSGDKYLYFNGTNYYLNNGQLYINNGSTLALHTANWSSYITSATTANVLAGVAATSANGVGCYALLKVTTASAYAWGSTLAGTSLVNWSAGNSGGAGSPAGTWRCMGYADGASANNDGRVTLWLRIS